MNKTAYFSYAVKAILTTAFLVLILNFACANGSGVKLLNLFGFVAEHELEIRSNIIKGVILMQDIIKIVALLGSIFFLWFVYKGLKTNKANFQI